MADVERTPVSGNCWTTLVATTIVVVSLTFLNLDGYQYELNACHMFEEPPTINWLHGWPCGSVVRASIYPRSGVFTSINGFTGPLGFYSRWPFDSAPVITFWLGSFVIDCLLFVLLVFGTAYGAGRLGKSFHLRFLFIATTLIAISCFAVVSTGVGSSIHAAYSSAGGIDRIRFSLQFLALFIAAAAIALTAFSTLHLTHRLLQAAYPRDGKG